MLTKLDLHLCHAFLVQNFCLVRDRLCQFYAYNYITNSCDHVCINIIINHGYISYLIPKKANYLFVTWVLTNDTKKIL